MMKKIEESEKAKILIIDDDPDLLQVLEGKLGNEGYSVITACDGTEGIKKNDTSDPALIILDLKMPGMGGIEALRRIRKTDKDVIVIIFTGYGNVCTAKEAVDLNIYKYISKPFEIDVIKSVVKEALVSQMKKPG